jgi:hypothetical protein
MLDSVRIASLVVLVAASGCRPHADVQASADASVCTRVGESCEFSAGKLGTCVRRDDCATEPCLVCQSQH